MNNLDFNIDQNNRVYDFSHNLAALLLGQSTAQQPVQRETLLLEIDVVFLPEPGVGKVAGIRLRLAREQGILGNVYSDVLWRRDDVRRACGESEHKQFSYRPLGEIVSLYID